MSDPTTPTDAAAGTSRRHFIRGVAAAGASTVAAASLFELPGVSDLLGDSVARAAGAPTPFAEFRAVAASSADAFEVPEGYRAHVVIKYGDEFANTDGTQLRFGYNNDFLAFFPLDGKPNEGLLFVNHEYPAPFLQHGNKDGVTKTAEQIALEQYSVGNSIVHVKTDAAGMWQVVSPSPYNRRITGTDPDCEFTGPLAGEPRLGRSARGSLANCSGGITPWGTALSCEENYDGYAAGSGYGWANANGIAADPTNAEYDHVAFSKYGWVVETDPYDPSYTPRKHTALGRFRHENTAFRAVEGKKFVLYMGDDKADAGVYKFVSDRRFIPGADDNNRRILEAGKLYIAWFDHSRREFARDGDSIPTTPTSGAGWWREVSVAELEDTNVLIRRAVEDEEAGAWNRHFATNRPEDVEVDVDGTVYIAFTNNSGVKDRHGSIRKLVEAGNDPTAVGEGSGFTWADYAGGGDRGADKPAGERGFSSCDNLVFDSQGNLWVVTDISSGSLAGTPGGERAPYYSYHGNNAVFMIPRRGPNAGVAFRFANMPVESEGTGPYFTPDERTLFVNVQHPGEETPVRGVYGDVSTYTSYWPAGNKTTGQNPSTPVPSLVAVTKLSPDAPPEERRPNVIPPPPPQPGQPGPGPGPAPGRDGVKPRLRVTELPRRRSQAQLLRGGLPLELTVDEPARATLVLSAKLPTIVGRGRRARRKQKLVVLGRATKSLKAGRTELALKLSPAAKLRVRALRGKDVTATLTIEARDAAGNRSAVKRTVKLV
jgi:secreted PhoX family phosphatase